MSKSFAIDLFVEGQPIGYIFSEEGVYEPGMITFTVREGEKVEIGDIVCIEHPSKPGVPVFYQVVEVPLRRRARAFEEDLARIGQPIVDDTKNYARARAKQIGYLDVDDLRSLLEGTRNVSYENLMMLVEHIKPLSPVYRLKPEIIERLLTPEAPSIEVGKIYPTWKHTLRFSLSKLLRQGLLVVGGIGTGKTTTMITMLLRVISAVKEYGGKPHILIIDKDGEYDVDEIKSIVGGNEYKTFDINDIEVLTYTNKEAYWNALLDKLVISKQANAAKELLNAIYSLGLKEYELTPEFVANNILKVISNKTTSKGMSIKQEIQMGLNAWKQKQQLLASKGKKTIDVKEVVEEVASKTVVRIDLSKTEDFNHAFNVLAELLNRIYLKALDDPSFGCIVVIDEAHLFAPEYQGGVRLADDDYVKRLRSILQLIATTGARNGVTLFIATQRPSLISKTITTQMGQNIIVHRVEDVDLERVREIVGPIAYYARVLPRGWAIVKGLAANIREPLIIRVRADARPKSAGKSTLDRFLSAKNQPTRSHETREDTGGEPAAKTGDRVASHGAP